MFNSWNVFVVSVFFVRGAGFSPQTSARQMLHPEDRRSSTGDAAFVSKHCKKKKTRQSTDVGPCNGHVQGGVSTFTCRLQTGRELRSTSDDCSSVGFGSETSMSLLKQEPQLSVRCLLSL